jgi:hypothetical protein
LVKLDWKNCSIRIEGEKIPKVKIDGETACDERSKKSEEHS